jgi:hypothetical protein
MRRRNGQQRVSDNGQGGSARRVRVDPHSNPEWRDDLTSDEPIQAQDPEGLPGGAEDHEEMDDLDEDDSLADGSSYRKEADGLDDLTADGSNYREIAKVDE